MTANTGTERRMLPLILLSLLVLAIGVRYIVASTGMPRLGGGMLVIGSLLTLSGYIFTLLARRRG